MKAKRLSIFIFLAISTWAFEGHGQVTINQSSFLRASAQVDSAYTPSQTTVSLPAEGSAQNWDYSTLSYNYVYLYTYLDAAQDPAFNNAFSKISSSFSFQAFQTQGWNYDGMDANGWYAVGRTTRDSAFSIPAISGGANDSLFFPASTEAYGGRTDYMKFPTTYPDQWTQTRTEITPFALTVGAFALNHTPGEGKRTQIETREIKGYGKLTIALADGSPSQTLDVLLLKVQRTSIDSFFLGGSLAPAPLMAAFGINQGMSVYDSYYAFYKPGYGAPVMTIDINSGAGGNVFVRPAAARSGNIAIQEYDQALHQSYPNPVAPAEQLHIDLDEPIKAAALQVINTNGQLVYEALLDGQASAHFECTIPSNLAPGLYFYQLINHTQRPLVKGRLSVQP
ncbi:MAG: hypothetical protein CMI36_12980 [Owenweeksia sp.]|nr:hypothetical protein [Owenweeksia sp.]